MCRDVSSTSPRNVALQLAPTTAPDRPPQAALPASGQVVARFRRSGGAVVLNNASSYTDPQAGRIAVWAGPVP
jgi:hypothetical protein